MRRAKGRFKGSNIDEPHHYTKVLIPKPLQNENQALKFRFLWRVAGGVAIEAAFDQALIRGLAIAWPRCLRSAPATSIVPSDPIGTGQQVPLGSVIGAGAGGCAANLLAWFCGPRTALKCRVRHQGNRETVRSSLNNPRV